MPSTHLPIGTLDIEDDPRQCGRVHAGRFDQRRQHMAESEQFDRGLEIRREVLGAD
jgi:hypothetical protein